MSSLFSAPLTVAKIISSARFCADLHASCDVATCDTKLKHCASASLFAPSCCTIASSKVEANDMALDCTLDSPEAHAICTARSKIILCFGKNNSIEALELTSFNQIAKQSNIKATKVASSSLPSAFVAIEIDWYISSKARHTKTHALDAASAINFRLSGRIAPTFLSCTLSPNAFK